MDRNSLLGGYQTKKQAEEIQHMLLGKWFSYWKICQLFWFKEDLSSRKVKITQPDPVMANARGQITASFKMADVSHQPKQDNQDNVLPKHHAIF